MSSDFPIGQQPATPEEFCLLSQGPRLGSEHHLQRSTGYSMDIRSMKNVTFRGARGQRRHSSSSPDSSGKESPADGSDQDYPRCRSPGIMRHSASTVRKSRDYLFELDGQLMVTVAVTGLVAGLGPAPPRHLNKARRAVR